MIAAAAESMDASHPKVDGVRVVLPSGRQARLSVSIPPRIDGTVSFSLRVPQKRNTTLSDLVSFGSMTSAAATCLEIFMKIRRTRVLVAGPPGAGKTTLIEALLRAVPARRRVICAEEQRELNAPLLNGEYWQSSKVETLTDLIRSARVASPELIVLGELKGAEAWELLMAGTLGVGVVAAVHAEDTSGAFEALAVCATKAVPATPFVELEARFAAMFDVVVYCDVDDSGDDRSAPGDGNFGRAAPTDHGRGRGGGYPDIQPHRHRRGHGTAHRCRRASAWNVAATGSWPVTASTWRSPEGSGGPLVKLLAAVMLGALAWAMARRLSVGGTGVGRHERAALRQLLFGGGRGARRSRASFQVWLSQAGAAVTPTQFWVVSAGVGAVAFWPAAGHYQDTVVSALPAGACAAAPYSYWSAQRRKQAAAR